MTGVEAEAANAEMERERHREQEGGVEAMREEDTTAAAIHGGFTPK